MATVYRAESDSGRPIAVKVLDATRASKETLERFRAEATLARAIEHPNVIAVFGTETLPSGAIAMAMEYLAGQTLAQRLEQFGPYTTEEALPILLRVCAALQAAHARGIIHRDLKPENIFLCDSGELKLLDFGISKATAPGNDHKRTRTGMVVGTPAYMAPEQTEGSRNATHLSDIFSLGVVACEMLTCVRPFERPGAALATDDSPTALLAQTIERYIAVRIGAEPQPTMADVLKSVRNHREDITPAWANSINAAISVDASRRPLTVRAFIEPIYQAHPYGDALVRAYAPSLIETSSALDKTVPATSNGRPTPQPSAAGAAGAATVEGRATLTRHVDQSTIAQASGQVAAALGPRRRWPLVVAGTVAIAATIAVVLIATRGNAPTRRPAVSPGSGGAPTHIAPSVTHDPAMSDPAPGPGVVADTAPDAGPAGTPAPADAGVRAPPKRPRKPPPSGNPDDIAP